MSLPGGSHSAKSDGTPKNSFSATPRRKMMVRVKLGTPWAALRAGDKAQAVTLALLEEFQDVIDKPDHNVLHQKYDALETQRLRIDNGWIRRMTQWKEIETYKNGAIALKQSTVVSSHKARSVEMWKKKGQPPSSSTSHSSLSDTVSHDPSDESPGDGAESASVTEFSPSTGTDGDTSSTPPAEGQEFAGQITAFDAAERLGAHINSRSLSMDITDTQLETLKQCGEVDVVIDPFVHPDDADAPEA